LVSVFSQHLIHNPRCAGSAFAGTGAAVNANQLIYHSLDERLLDMQGVLN